ncbi:hypothetical protein AGMMS49944_03870 [Spirochaetia bacterium]|nr:hypothetical protein AGMMS49944_03870 [Spirochaetia bacterium]
MEFLAINLEDFHDHQGGAIDGLHYERVSIVVEHVEFKPEFHKDLKKSGQNDPPKHNPGLFSEASKMVDTDDLYEEEDK